MNEFLQKITRENWGFPYHLFLSAVLAVLFFWLFVAGFIFFKFPISKDLIYRVAVYSFFSVNLAGYLNEVVQKKNGRNPRRDFWQDITANNIGAGVVLIIQTAGFLWVLSTVF